MKPVKKIKLTGLMATKAARGIFDILQGDTKEPQILFVGGCVRNALLGEPVSDIDLATKSSPQEVTKRLKAAGVKVIPTGIDHGTVTAVLDGESFQITTLRRDVETDGRFAKVEFTDDWAADARRRDFTLNTLLADIKGNIFDPLGVGVRDLEKLKIVFVGDPKTRIQEDYLRILRFFRFYAWYGKGKPDEAAVKACAALSRNLKTLSKERVTQEILKIISSPDAAKTLALMQQYKILPGVINPKAETLRFNTLKKLNNVDVLTLGLLILANFSNRGTVRIVNALRLTNGHQKQIDGTIFYLGKFKNAEAHQLKVLLYRAGHEVAELVLISRLILNGSGKIQNAVDSLRKMQRPVLPLRGQDLIDQGMKPGPDIKKALDKFERFWIRKGFI